VFNPFYRLLLSIVLTVFCYRGVAVRVLFKMGCHGGGRGPSYEREKHLRAYVGTKLSEFPLTPFCQDSRILGTSCAQNA